MLEGDGTGRAIVLEDLRQLVIVCMRGEKGKGLGVLPVSLPHGLRFHLRWTRNMFTRFLLVCRQIFSTHCSLREGWPNDEIV